MSDISFFARRSYLNVSPRIDFEYSGTPPERGYLKRVSSIIRADQVAAQIGAKLNPESGYENDICIYIKPYIPRDGSIKFEGRQPYVDIIDSWGHLPILSKHPNVNVIALSRTDADTLIRVLPNKVVFIPQHHANFERVKRTRNEVTRVGVIGTEPAFPYLPDGLKNSLGDRGMELVTFSKFFRRQDIIDFYQSIDVQVVWRPYKKRLANPLKIVNGAAFGVPTIALDEPYFHEMQHYYFPIKDFRGLISVLDRLRAQPDLYNDYSERGFRRAEDYHIENVGKMYKNLAMD